MTGSPTLIAPHSRGRSLVEWGQTDHGYRGGDYEIVLTAPHRWEVRFRGALVDETPTRELAFRTVDVHRRGLASTLDPAGPPPGRRQVGHLEPDEIF